MNKKAVLFFASFVITVMGCKNNSNSNTTLKHSAIAGTATIKQKWHWGQEQKQDESAGYTQVVRAGNTLYISGIPTSNLSPEGIIAVYKDLEKCLNAFGASPKDVVKETLYTTDIEEMKKYNGSRKKFYKGDYPAATWVQVSRLYEPDAKLEIELIAQLNDVNRK